MSQAFTILEDADVDPPLNAPDLLNHSNIKALDSKPDDQVVAGAAVAGAAVGVLVGGPLIGLVGAGAAAYAATCENQVGDVARSAGTTTVAMGRRLAKYDKDHNVSANVKTAATGAMNKAKELNEKHQILNRTQNAAAGAYNKAADINKKYQVLPRIGRLVMRGLSRIAKVLNPKEAPPAAAPAAPAAADAAGAGVPTGAPSAPPLPVVRADPCAAGAAGLAPGCAT